MVRLYGTQVSPFVARVRIQLVAKSLPFELVAPPGGVGSAELRALSPLGRVPILEVGGQLLPESGVIQEYLEDAYPLPGLRGRSPMHAARVRLIARIADLYLIPALQPLRALLKSPQSTSADDTRRGLEDALGSLDHYLEGGPFAVGGELSLADCTLAPFLLYVNRFAAALFPDFSLKRWSKLSACEHGMRQHPAVAAVLADMTAALAQPRAKA